MTSLELAELFHKTYEELAPSFGYETRKDTKKFDPDSANGKLMAAVCQTIIDRFPTLKAETRNSSESTTIHALKDHMVKTKDDTVLVDVMTKYEQL